MKEHHDMNVWLKPSEVTQPGAYWVADIRGGWEPSRKLYVANIGAIRAGALYEIGRHGRLLSDWDKGHRLLGPITPPGYTGDRK